MLKKVGRLLRSKRGAALIIAMLLLIILTVLGLAGVQTSTTEIEIAANERRAQCALYAADAGLQFALERVCGMNTDAIPLTGIGNNAFFRSDGPITLMGSVRVPGGFNYKLYGFRITGTCGDPNNPRTPEKAIDVYSRRLGRGGEWEGKGSEWGPTGYNVGL